MSDLFRLYSAEELGKDGYPTEWHQTIKHLVREQAGHRCVRCGHPYRVGNHKMEAVGTPEGIVYESWTPCDIECSHGGPARVWSQRFNEWKDFSEQAEIRNVVTQGYRVEARARILTVHHLNGDKSDCRWWNLASLCQRCHLTIQSRVQLHRVWSWEHSDWFKPYAAGWYAHAYLGEDLDRERTMARLDELLALELMA